MIRSVTLRPLYALLIACVASLVSPALADGWAPSLADKPVADEPGFWLARDGKPAATIVIAQDALDTNQQAAEWLQTYVEKISGATLPIVDDTAAVDGPTVLIGRSARVDALNLDIPEGYSRALNEEGYLIKVIGNQLVLVGNDHRPLPAYKGSMFAVIEVLGRLGCRWYYPGEFGEVHPRSADISLPALDLKVQPSLPVRGFWYGVGAPRRRNAELHEQMTTWQARNRYMPYGTVLPPAGDGSIMRPFRDWERREVDGQTVRVNTMFERSPEYFALKKDGTRDEHYLCLSNPDVLDVITEYVSTYFEQNPDALGFPISPPDGAPTCECEDCHALNMRFMQKDPSDPAIQDISGGFYWFMNELAKRVEKSHPDKWVASLAYSGRIRPPEAVDIHPNITLHTALLAHSRHHQYDWPTWQTQERVQIYKRWVELSDFIVEREYYPVFQFNCNVFQPMYRSSAYNIRFIEQLGLRGAEWEGRTSFFMEGLNNYVRGQLLWNTHTDLDALLEDHYTRFYGPAAPVVQRFDEAVEQMLTESMVDFHEEERIPEIYPHAQVVSITDAVGDVERLVADADEKTRWHVAYFRMRVDHFRAYSDMREAERHLDFARAAEKARFMIEIEEQIDQINYTFIDTTNIIMDQRPVYGELGANATAHGKLKQYLAKQRLIDGTEGELVTALPITWQFAADPRDQGVLFQWHRSDVQGPAWRDMDTTASWEIQGMQDEQAYGYDGFAWYRTTFEVPQQFAGRDMTLFLGGFNNQAWIWVNNRLIAATPYHAYWERWKYHDQIDIGPYLKAGETNRIAIRLWNDQGHGGLFRRSFIYAPVDSR